jgi:hypothetical protein
MERSPFSRQAGVAAPGSRTEELLRSVGRGGVERRCARPATPL